LVLNQHPAISYQLVPGSAFHRREAATNPSNPAEPVEPAPVEPDEPVEPV